MSAVTHGDRNRALPAALLGSVALHAALLFSLPVRMTGQAPPAPPEPFLARLEAQAEPPAQKPPPPAERKAKPRPKPSAKKPTIAAKKAPAIPKPEAVSPAPPPAAVASQPPPRIEMPSHRVEPAPPAPPPRPDTGKLSDEAVVADYRAQLLSVARKFKRYPSVARDNGWEGEAVVRIMVGTEDAEAQLALATSSGHAVLDRQALQMFKRALRQVPVPAELQGKPFSMELRAVYRLNDQGSG